jgi:hypothetical protein
VRQLRNRAAHGRIIGAFHNLIQLRQTETANHQLMRFRGRNKASIILNANLATRSRSTLGFLRSTRFFGGWALCFSGHDTSLMENDK